MTLLNAPDHLLTPTHDGSNQATHPAVIDFLVEFNMSEWAGYRYWMAMTPLPFADDTHEDPNVLASHNGIDWVVPDGLVNPLHDARTAENPGFDSDTDLVYNPVTNELWVYYRYITNTVYEIHLVKVKTDRSYSEPIIVYRIDPFPADGSVNSKTRSMTIWRESANRWHMWGLSGNETSAVNIYYFSSINGINWSESQNGLNAQGVDPIQAALPGIYIWHFYAKANPRERRIEFLCQTRGVKRALYHMQCSMDTPTLFEVPVTTPVVAPSGGDNWDGLGMYRSAFVIEPDLFNKSYKYHVWYCGVSKLNEYNIGYTSGTLATSFKEIFSKGGYQVNNGVNYRIYKPLFAVLDTFSRGDNPTSLGVTESGQAWSILDGTWGVIGGAAYTSVATATVSRAVVDSGLSNCVLTVKISEGISNARNRVLFRVTDNSNHLYIVTTTTGYALSRVMGGSISTLGTYDKTLANGDVIKVVMNSSKIEFYVNDVLAVSHTDTFNQNATKHGIAIYNSTLARFDDFRIEEL